MTMRELELWQDRAIRHLEEIAKHDFGKMNGFHALVALHHIKQIEDGLATEEIRAGGEQR